MRYLSLIDLPSTDLTRVEEDYLDEQLAFEAWAKKSQGRHGRSIHVIEAIDIFKENMYDLCMDHMMGDEKEKFSQLLEKSRDNSTKLDIVGAKNYPIEELIRRAGCEPRMNFVKCLFHDDGSASLKIYPQTNTWYCFGCNQGSSTVDFVMKLNKCTFKEAVKYLT